MKKSKIVISILVCVIVALAVLLTLSLMGVIGNKNKAKDYETFEYTHYATGGNTENYNAVILFEQSNSTFTSYQIAFSSCTCRDALVSYYSVLYVELLNTKESSDDIEIRTISVSDNKGLYGDSNPNYYVPEYTDEYMNEKFIQKLVKTKKSDYDDWQGYGNQIDGVDVQAVTGASVTTSNYTSVLKGLMQYHADKYYKNK